METPELETKNYKCENQQSKEPSTTAATATKTTNKFSKTNVNNKRYKKLFR